jgi:nucleoside-diphosphate-sugar epimerase
VVKAHIAAVERGKIGENYSLAGTRTSFLEMLTIIAELLGKPPPRRVIPPAMVRLLARVQDIGALITGKRPQITPEVAALATRSFTCPSRKAQQELGFKLVPIRTMLQDCYDWLVATGRLKSED